MVTTHNLGFPRIGAKRELKFALESFWKNESGQADLDKLGAQLRERHWNDQDGLDLVPVGDFSFYDQVLDMSFMLGNVPARAHRHDGSALDSYFRVARGRSANDSACSGVHAGEMTKWFDTNYHYIVPEFTNETAFALDDGFNFRGNANCSKDQLSFLGDLNCIATEADQLGFRKQRLQARTELHGFWHGVLLI